MKVTKALATGIAAAVSAALILSPMAYADTGIFTLNEAHYLDWLAGQGILPQTLGLTNGRDEVGFGYGICDALNDHSASDVDAGIKSIGRTSPSFRSMRSSGSPSPPSVSRTRAS
jgi:hypothetical protein